VLSDACAMPVEAMIRKYREEFEYHITEKAMHGAIACYFTGVGRTRASINGIEAILWPPYKTACSETYRIGITRWHFDRSGRNLFLGVPDYEISCNRRGPLGLQIMMVGSSIFLCLRAC
jgi:hypothetical protein